MSKLFKILGVGSAVGVITYVVIKYKNDQKFKEKVDSVADKGKETAGKAFDKTMTVASNFTTNHPKLFMAGLFTLTITPAIIHAVNADARKREMMQRAYEDYKVSSDCYDMVDEECDRINEKAKAAMQKQMLFDDIMNNPENYLIVSKDEWNNYQDSLQDVTHEVDSSWKEDYRDTWDEVTELSKRVKLAPGESYMIEEASQYDVKNSDGPIVSHLIYGTGCYPPEELVD